MSEARRRQWPHLANATDIDRWADKIVARSELARLVRGLIDQTNDQVTLLDMPAGEGTDLPGYDGIVETTKGTAFVPHGRSVWELGTSGDPARKASEDYRERTKNPLGADKLHTTFVFVTPREWQGKRAWADRRRKRHEWLDVRAFDVHDIELAFERAPAAHLRFSEVLGKPAYGVRTIEDWWSRFATDSNPPLTPELVLAGRADDAAALLRLFDEDVRRTTITAASTDDVLAFVAATILSASGDRRIDLLARTLIVRDAFSLRVLDSDAKLLILLPFDEELHREAQLVRSHHVVLLAPPDTPADINLRPLDQKQFASLLTGVGVSEERSRELARAAGRSLLAYQRQASAPSRTAVRPEWTRRLGLQVTRRAWLCGSWTELRSGDADVMSALLGRPYEDAQEELRAAATGEDPLFVAIGSVWSVASPETTWNFARPHLTAADLGALETAIQTVLGAIDPALELKPEERWMAAVHGKSRIHSSHLRTGLATTLALLGSYGSSLHFGGGATARTWADRTVAQLLERANRDTTGQLWTSLSDVLPLLAEATPDQFLRAVRSGVSGADPVIGKLFTDQGDGFMASSAHTGLLWALEGLARSPSYLGSATDLLAKLTEIDSGGRLANRPRRSLTEILLPWFPQTLADVSTRLAALEAVVARHPEVGWALLLSLMPHEPVIATQTHVPRFREWKPTGDRVTTREYLSFVDSITDLAETLVSESPERWPALIEQIPDLPPAQRLDIYTRLEQAVDGGRIGEELKLEIWQTLGALVRQHRTHINTSWGLPGTELNRIDKIVAELVPEDPVKHYSWLFATSMPDIGTRRTEDFAAHEGEVTQERSKALRVITDREGLSGIHRLLTVTKEHFQIGWVAAAAQIDVDENQVLEGIDSADTARSEFARGFAWQRAQTGGWDWIDRTLPQLAGRPRAQARVLICFRDFERVWKRAKELGSEVDNAYWEEFQPYGLGPDFALVPELAAQLLEHHRPIAAVAFLSMYLNNEGTRISPELVATALEALLADIGTEQRQVPSYDITSLLDYLRSTAIDEERLALLEWQLLPGLGYGARSPVLERRLAQSSTFFVEVLSLCFKRRDGEVDREVKPGVAENAFRLVQDWKIVPGSQDRGGDVDQESLMEWLTETRRLLAEAGRSEVGDIYIGHVFAHAKQDVDGSWPTLPVRNAIETLGSDHVDQGFASEIYNKRGVVTRGLDEGGQQEYALAEQFEAWAGQSAVRWPRTATVLRATAESYRAEGRAHDEEARRIIEGMD